MSVYEPVRATGLIGPGTNVTFTGTGTKADPYVVNSTAAGGGGGTVTSVAATNTQGVTTAVTNATTTPSIAIGLGAITPTSVAASGTVTGSNLSGTNTGDQTSVTGNAGTATTLQTARTIAGQSFNGSTNISIASTDLSDTASIVLLTSTQTLTNKRMTPRIGTTTTSATPTPTGDSADQYTVTALNTNATIAAPTGTPTDGQDLWLRIKDDGNVRTLTFNAAYRFSSDLAAPTATVVSKTLYMRFKYNSADSKWDCLAWLSNF